MRISEYRAVWLFVLFDLPMDTPKCRRVYTTFRKHLLKDGFTMLQYSVYLRHCASSENADVHVRRVEDWLPAQGKVSIMSVTDKQFANMRCYWGNEAANRPGTPSQLELF